MRLQVSARLSQTACLQGKAWLAALSRDLNADEPWPAEKPEPLLTESNRSTASSVGSIQVRYCVCLLRGVG
jgi:hypothetical protein